MPNVPRAYHVRYGMHPAFLIAYSISATSISCSGSRLYSLEILERERAFHPLPCVGQRIDFIELFQRKVVTHRETLLLQFAYALSDLRAALRKDVIQVFQMREAVCVACCLLIAVPKEAQP